MSILLRRRNTPDAEDFFTPGSDLVLCILAMAVLILIMVGISSWPEGARVKKTKVDAQSQIQVTAEKLSEAQKEKKRLERKIEEQAQGIARLERELAQAKVVIGEQRARIEELESRVRPVPPSASDSDRVVLKPSRGRSPYEQNGYDLSDSGISDLINGLRSKRDEFIRSGANTLLVEGSASAEPDRTTDVRTFWDMAAYRVVECNRESIKETKDCREHFTFDRNLDLAFRRARRVWEYLVFRKGLPRWCATIVTHGRNRSVTLENQVGRLAGEVEIRGWDLRWPDNRDESSTATATTNATPPMSPNDPRLIEERKVEIRAISDPNSLCQPSDLATALQRL